MRSSPIVDAGSVEHGQTAAVEQKREARVLALDYSRRIGTEAPMVFWGGLAACVTSLGLMLGVGPIETSALGAIPEIALTLALFFTICAAEARV